MIEIKNKAQVWMGDDNILIIKMLPKSQIEESDVFDIIDASAKESRDTVHCNLADISELGFISRKARAVFGKQEKKDIRAIAIVSRSTIQKSFANLYLGFSKPIIPTKFFGKMEDAKSWLIKELAK